MSGMKVSTEDDTVVEIKTQRSKVTVDHLLGRLQQLHQMLRRPTQSRGFIFYFNKTVVSFDKISLVLKYFYKGLLYISFIRVKRKIKLKMKVDFLINIFYMNSFC